MEALWITLAVIGGLLFLLIFLLIVGNAKIRITCKQKVKVVASVFGIRFTLLSDKKGDEEAKNDLSRCHNPERVLRKELRRQRRESKKALKKKRKAERKAAKKKERKKAKKAVASTQPSPNLTENLSMITALIKKLYSISRGKLKVRVRKMHISVATGDAAKTAILYGVVVQSAAYILQILQTQFLDIEREPGDMQICADYLSEKSRANIDIVFRLRLIHAVRIGIGMLLSYTKEKTNAMEKAKKRIKKKKKPA